MIDYTKDYYTGLSKMYFERILKKIIQLGDLRNEQGIILDFGCGHGYLKTMLPQQNVVGYDIIEDLSDVKDYKKVKPQVIVCNNILEHFTEKGIKQKLKEFKKMNKHARIITAVPTENWLSSIGMKITGRTNAHDDHKTKRSEINEILTRECELINRKNVVTLSEISVWVFKEK